MDRTFFESVLLTITEPAFYNAAGEPVARPVFPFVPEGKYLSLEVEDSKAGRSAVAVALNHGNSKLPFKDVRLAAESPFNVVNHANQFQGIVFSDVSAKGANRLIFGNKDYGAFDDAFQIPDREHDGIWHVFSLWDTDGATDFRKGDGFLMFSAKDSYIGALYTGKSWFISGGGGSAYSGFLNKAIQVASATKSLFQSSASLRPLSLSPT